MSRINKTTTNKRPDKFNHLAKEAVGLSPQTCNMASKEEMSDIFLWSHGHNNTLLLPFRVKVEVPSVAYGEKP